VEQVDWNELFHLSLPFWELIIRGSAMYWFLFLIFRFIVRRDMGSVGIADILILVIIADASQNAFSGEYRSVTDGMVLVSVLVGWNYLLNWINFRVPAFRRFSDPSPLLLVRDGRLIRHNMRAEQLTEEELLAKMREQGVRSLKSVKRMYMESDGSFSVIKNTK
jgi:uncharacterized membrane protein YcaP (DUF421 family)